MKKKQIIPTDAEVLRYADAKGLNTDTTQNFKDAKNDMMGIKPELPKILITVEGGIVQSICTNLDAQIVVVDYDKHGDERIIVSDKLEPDTIIANDNKFYKELFKKNSTDKDELFVHKKLKKLNF